MSTRYSPLASHDIVTKIASVTQTDADWLTDIDTLNARGVLITLTLGAFNFTASNNLEFTFKDSDDGTTYADVEERMVDGEMADDGKLVKRTTAVTGNGAVYKWAYLGKKRYLQIGVTETGNVTADVCANVILTDLRVSPSDVPT